MMSSDTGSDDLSVAPVGDNDRLVFVIEALTIGGAEQMLIAMANYLQKSGWQCHMVCLTLAGELADKLDEGVTLHVLDKRPGVDFALAARLRKLINAINPLAVNSHLWTANLWTRLALVGAGRRIVVTEHSRDTWKPVHYRLIDRLLAFVTYRLVAVSTDTARFYTDQIKIPAHKVTVINNGIDTRRYATVDDAGVRQALADDDQLLIGTVGRMITAKNHPRLVRTFACLADEFPQLKLVFVGDGPERGALEATIEDTITAVSDRSRIQLTGTRRDVASILKALDVFVLSSDREGHPMTALEAQTAGTPVVLTDAGGSADALVRHPDCPVTVGYGEVPRDTDDLPLAAGMLVEPSVDALTLGLRQLIENNELRVAMGRLGAEHAPRMFDERVMVRAYVGLFTN